MNPIDYKELLPRYFSGEASKDERARVESWRQASTENKRLFAEYEKLWKSATERSPEIPDIDQTWDELAVSLGLSGEAKSLEIKPPLAKKFSWSDSYIWAAAAVILLAFTAIFYWVTTNSGLKTITTAYSERRDIELSDGSVVKLNSDSQIQFQRGFSDSARIVTLAGEAYFEVASDGRPFIVQTGNARVRVLGTKFGVWARAEETRVTVREGRVALRAAIATGEAGIVLAANQRSSVRGQAVPEFPTEVPADYLLGWLEGRIVFDRTPLSEVVAELERVYGTTIELSDPDLGRGTITGSFENKQVEPVLTAICRTLNLNFTTEADKLVIHQ
jgi:transmembrane sensor